MTVRGEDVPCPPVTALDRRGAPEGPTDHRWQVVVNAQIEPDL